MLCIDVHAEPPLVFLSRQNQIVVVVQPIELVGWQSGHPAAELPQSLRPPASVRATARYRPTRDGRVGQTDFHLESAATSLTFALPPVVCQGCVYGEGKVLQPASNGGFEAASYFTNSAASHSAGESRMCCSLNNLRKTSSAWRKLLINDEKSVFKLICWFEWLSSFLHCHLHVLHNTTFT